MNKNKKNNGTKLSSESLFMYSCLAILSLGVLVLLGKGMLPSAATGDKVFVFTAAILAIIIPTAIAFFKRDFKASETVVFFGIILACAVFARLAMFEKESADYTGFLTKWVAKMRELSGVKPITTPIGNYNIPYLYLLFFISRIDVNDLYLIKLASVAFDIFTAYFAMKLVGIKTDNDIIKMGAFAFILFAPQVMLNSAYWSQCDAIYVGLALAGLYFGLTDRPARCMVFMALSFTFKLQAIFILPLVALLIFRKNIKLQHIVYYPITIIAVSLPAMLCGRSINNTFSIYFGQADQYDKLTLNAPNFWSIFPERAYQYLVDAAIIVALVATVFFVFALSKKVHLMGERELILAALIGSFILPFLLPKMHERYFFMAEMLSIVYTFYNPKKWYLAAVLIFGALASYMPYLFVVKDWISFRNLAIVYFAAIVLYVIELIGLLRDKENKAREA